LAGAAVPLAAATPPAGPHALAVWIGRLGSSNGRDPWPTEFPVPYSAASKMVRGLPGVRDGKTLVAYCNQHTEESLIVAMKAVELDGDVARFLYKQARLSRRESGAKKRADGVSKAELNERDASYLAGTRRPLAC
jgi:hypothetical protein